MKHKEQVDHFENFIQIKWGLLRHYVHTYAIKFCLTLLVLLILLYTIKLPKTVLTVYR